MFVKLRSWIGLSVGLALLSPSIVEAGSSCIPGFSYAVFTDGKMQVENHAISDSYDSSLGPYSAGGCNGNLGTNTSTSAAVVLQNHATICGTIETGVGGTVTTAGVASYTAPSGTLSPPITLTPVTVPSPALPSGGAASFGDNAIHALAPNKTYSTISCTKPHTKIQLSAGTYVTTDIVMAQCAIQVTSGPVVVYVKGKLDMSSNTTINAPSTSGLPTNLVFLGTSTATEVHMNSGSVIYGGLYFPNAAIHIEQSSEVFGAIVGKSFHGENYGKIHYDQSMANLGAGGFACASEVSRASPIIAAISGSTAIVQGTYMPPSGTKTQITTTAEVASFTFPHIRGHMRARTTGSIATTADSFASGTILFDVAASGKIPTHATSYGTCASYDGTCRNVFTNTNSTPTDGRTFHPALVQLNATTASTIGALIAPSSVVSGIGSSHWATIVQKVIDAPLGGVDRSTVAVIEPSTIAGASTRPTIAYFGGTDGMLHAVCASTAGTTPSESNICPSLGTEIWAFLPRVELPRIRTNSARIDGSVRVVDVFGDFTTSTANGPRSWHTILTFSVGNVAGTYALDVTDPANPIILWEVVTPTALPSGHTLELGTGLIVAAGTTRIGGQLANLAVAETNNGFSTTAGVVVKAMSLETGLERWHFEYTYPTSVSWRTGSTTPTASGIPGGAVGVDLLGSGDLTDFVFGDLYGNLWRIKAVDGTTTTGAGTPLFSFSSHLHPIGVPPTIYRSNGALFAAFVSGGYADPAAAAWTTSSQYLMAVNLKPSTLAFPITESGTVCSTCDLMVKESLSGQKGFAQAIVVGTQLFVTSDSTDTNLSSFGTGGNTGTLTTVSLTGAATTTTSIRSGASSLASSGTTLYSSSSDRQARLATSALTTTGPSVDPSSVPKGTRSLWIRTE